MTGNDHTDAPHGDVITGALRSPALPSEQVDEAAVVANMVTFAEARQRFERDYLVGLLKLTDGNVADAARLADRNRTEFYRLMQKHGLSPGHFKPDPPQASPA